MVDEAFAKFPAAFPCAMPAPPAQAEPTTPGYGGQPGALSLPVADPSCHAHTAHCGPVWPESPLSAPTQEVMYAYDERLSSRSCLRLLPVAQRGCRETERQHRP